ncbi:hypothetical protein L9F63_020761, partial [Diploptera punctata]
LRRKFIISHFIKRGDRNQLPQPQGRVQGFRALCDNVYRGRLRVLILMSLGFGEHSLRKIIAISCNDQEFLT